MCVGGRCDGASLLESPGHGRVAHRWRFTLDGETVWCTSRWGLVLGACNRRVGTATLREWDPRILDTTRLQLESRPSEQLVDVLATQARGFRSCGYLPTMQEE